MDSIKLPDHVLPDNVFQGTDGSVYRNIPNLTSGAIQAFRVCEDCYQIIPRYIDFPRGLVSPDSDGDRGGNFAKTRITGVGEKSGVEHLQKVVCLDCYLSAFSRWYPDAPPPDLRPDVVGGGLVADPVTIAPIEAVDAGFKSEVA